MREESLDRAGRSELHYAARDGDIHEASRLIRTGADVNLRDKGGFTPLHFAAQEQRLEAARVLLESGAKIEERDEHGATPLLKAVGSYRGEGEVILLLRKWGANPLAKNNYGISPVDSARQTANYDVAKFFDDIPK